MAFTQLPFHPMTSEVEAQTLNSPAFDVGGMTELDVVVKMNAMSSAGVSFDVDIQHSMDMKDWYSLGTVLVAVTTATDKVKSFTDFMRYVRAVSQIKGAAKSATYSILGIAKDGT